MDRRSMFKSAAGGLLLAAISGRALAKDEHSHGHAAGHGPNPHGGLIDAASTAVVKGQACLSHCVSQMAQGEKELGECAKLATDMITACTAIQQLAGNGSAHLAGMAKAAVAICDDCEKECRKFENKHEVCKSAAEACKTCRQELTKVAA